MAVRDDDKLAHAITGRQANGLIAEIYQRDANLAAIPAVYYAHSVSDRNTLFRRKPRTREQQSDVTARNRNRQPASDDDALHRIQTDVIEDAEVKPRISKMSVLGSLRARIDALDLHPSHYLSPSTLRTTLTEEAFTHRPPEVSPCFLITTLFLWLIATT